MYLIKTKSNLFLAFKIHLSISGIQKRVLDVTKSEDVKKFAEEFDRIDILFNCAGYGILVLCFIFASY